MKKDTAGTRQKPARTLLAWSVLAFAIPAQPAMAQGNGAPQLAGASLEELMNIEVTSVSKKEQALSKTGAAVFVIGQDDIRRSGATNIPDLLRMAPGVDVAQIDANQWAISIRGFNDLYSNKVLVLIDGRTVYVNTFSGSSGIKSMSRWKTSSALRSFGDRAARYGAPTP